MNRQKASTVSKLPIKRFRMQTLGSLLKTQCFEILIEYENRIDMKTGNLLSHEYITNQKRRRKI